MRVLDRIMAAKPTVRLESLLKHEKQYKKIKKNLNVGNEQAKHGYPARGSRCISLPRAESILRSSRRGGSVLHGKKLNELSCPTEEMDSVNESMQVRNMANMNQTLSDFRKTNNSLAVKRASASGMTPLSENPGALPNIRRNFKMRHGSLRGSTSPRHISPSQHSK